MQLHLFTRTPVAGHCKTRLIPRLGPRGAAWVQRRLIEHALAVGCAALGPENLTLWGAPNAAHAFFSRCRFRHNIGLARQVGTDLGARMRRTLNHTPGLLIGSDAFGLQADDLLKAATALQHSDYVLLPALDGGFVLIGARKALPSLAGVRWSSGRELRQTVRRLSAAGSLTVMPVAREDFDTPSDWHRARRKGRLKPLVRL